jgi:hypothetical protein
MTRDSSTPTPAECKCDPHVEYCDACLPPSVRAGVAPPAAAEPQSITIDHLPGTTGDSLEDGIAYLKAAAAEPLSDALRALIRAYVNLLENGRDRIRMLGGECDDVPTMERSDPHLRAARAALSTHAAPARNSEPVEPAEIVGDTRFEGWLSERPESDPLFKRSRDYHKQDMRDAYWAGYCERRATQLRAPARNGGETGEVP